MKVVYIGEAGLVVVSAPTSGLTDIEVVVTKPDGTDIATNLSLSEISNKKVYTAGFTAAVEGTYLLEIESPTDASIDGKQQVVLSKPLSKKDLGGTGFDGSTDSLQALSSKLDTVVAGQNSQRGGFME